MSDFVVWSNNIENTHDTSMVVFGAIIRGKKSWERTLWLVAFLQKITCNLRQTMSLRHIRGKKSGERVSLFSSAMIESKVVWHVSMSQWSWHTWKHGHGDTARSVASWQNRIQIQWRPAEQSNTLAWTIFTIWYAHLTGGLCQIALEGWPRYVTTVHTFQLCWFFFFVNQALKTKIWSFNYSWGFLIPIDRGSSKVKHSFVRELSNIVDFEYMWSLALDLAVVWGPWRISAPDIDFVWAR